MKKYVLNLVKAIVMLPVVVALSIVLSALDLLQALIGRSVPME